MRVICKPVNAPAYDAEMTMDEIRDFIGGWLEHVRLDRATHLLCDEEGLLKCLPGNCAIEGTMYHGPIVILGLNSRGDDFGDSPMTADDAKLVFPSLTWGKIAYIIEDGYYNDPSVCSNCGQHVSKSCTHCRHCGAKFIKGDDKT